MIDKMRFARTLSAGITSLLLVNLLVHFAPWPKAIMIPAAVLISLGSGWAWARVGRRRNKLV